MNEHLRDLCNYWKMRATALHLAGKWDEIHINEFKSRCDKYLNSLNFYSDSEQDVPNWLEKEMGKFFKYLEDLDR